jgi:hypothetical protein
VALHLEAALPTAATPSDRTSAIPDSELDLVLSAQLIVAWAGESGEERRLGWWRTDLVSEFGGYDLFKRLLPRTWDWAALQGAREAARRRDAELRARASDPDKIVSLFRLGFAIDERVDERLQEHKRAGKAPNIALPSAGSLISEHWSADAFLRWIASHGEAEHTAAPIGRLLKGAPPASPGQQVRSLVAALLPLADSYPLPHFRRPS